MRDDPGRAAEVIGVTFDWSGLKALPTRDAAAQWVADGGVHVVIHSSAPAPDWPGDLRDLQALQEARRAWPSFWGIFVQTLLECEVTNVGGCEAVRVLIKQPFNFHVLYEAQLVLPFADRTVTLRVWAIEPGIYTTEGWRRLRDRVILEGALRRGEVQLGADGRVRGWYRDLYDQVLAAATLAPFGEDDDNDVLWRKITAVRSVADDERHDLDFPDHALTKVRRLFGRILATVRVDGRLRARPPDHAAPALGPDQSLRLRFDDRDETRRRLSVGAVLAVPFAVFAALATLSVRQFPPLLVLALAGLGFAGVIFASALRMRLWPNTLAVEANVEGLQVSGRRWSRRIGAADLVAFRFDPFRRRLSLRLTSGETVALDAPITCVAAEHLWYALARRFPDVPREVA